jgi:hypothetical protein
MQIEIKELHGYYEGDEENDCGGDYDAIEVIIDGETVAEYGDHYHDKGFEKAEGFVEGYLFALNKECKIKYTREPFIFE